VSTIARCALAMMAVTAAVAGCGTGESATTTAPAPAPTRPVETTASPPTTQATTTTVSRATTTEPMELEVPEPELRSELIVMFDADQAERRAWDELPAGETIPPSGDPGRTRRLQEIIAEHGWPTISMVGRRGATAAWLVAQHSDFDPGFQVEALGLMEAAAEAGEADPVELAYLTDRVASSLGEEQTYGTQIGCVDGEIGPVPSLVDRDRVDEWRAAVGLGTLDEYYAEFGPGGCS
jgi:hypothetical protein